MPAPDYFTPAEAVQVIIAAGGDITTVQSLVLHDAQLKPMRSRTGRRAYSPTVIAEFARERAALAAAKASKLAAKRAAALAAA